ncbi:MULTISPECIES: NAD-dependent epimerase/dehydratase family protein [unclassified Nocardia]|uniref:NAD-dependent epimerase/dehydratase family protein n=1 Tax=unclassified Nocardia TaxID=2637762 RepID=UPI001CE3EBA2|nr:MULTISPECIES: NAD-dependent epimerase/dehydratase family protein [unclassified Nocardia]
MKLLVTGCAGAIGNTVVRLLSDAGHEVVVADAAADDAGQFPPEVRSVPVRLHDIAQFLTNTAGFDAVLHFAGEFAADSSATQPEWQWDSATSATLALLDAMSEAGIGKLVFSCTTTAYDSPADTKLPIERAITSYTRCCGLGAVSLRCLVTSDNPDADHSHARAHLRALDSIHPGRHQIYNLDHRAPADLLTLAGHHHSQTGE